MLSWVPALQDACSQTGSARTLAIGVAPARGRGLRSLSLGPCPGRVSALHWQSADRLDVPHAPEPGLGGRTIAYPRGKLIGGCSSINGMIYMRGQAADYNGWAQLGCRGWTWDDVYRYSWSPRATTAMPKDMALLARCGWNDSACIGQSSTRCARPPPRSAFPRSADFNLGDNEGSGYFEVNQRAACAGVPLAHSCRRRFAAGAIC